MRRLLLTGLSLLLLSCSSRPLRDESSIERFLVTQGYAFSIDAEGDYKLTIPLEDQSETAVWIRRELNFSGDEAVREIFSVGAVLDEEQTAYLSQYLLQDNFQTRVTGSWAYIRDGENQKVILIYLLKLPLSTEQDFLENALREAAVAAQVMENVIHQGD